MEPEDPADVYSDLPKANHAGLDLIKQRNKIMFDEESDHEDHSAPIEAPVAGQNQSSHFTLNKYESKPELKKAVAPEPELNMQTAHFKKQGGPGSMAGANSENPSSLTENPDKDIYMIDQRGFQLEHAESKKNEHSQYHDSYQKKKVYSQGTGQFGTKETTKFEQHEQASYVDQFRPNPA